MLTVNLDTNVSLQDLRYWYDPVGNITQVQDDAQQTLFFNNSVVPPTQMFRYDALYRLTEAGGRELAGTAGFGTDDNWQDSYWMGQPQPGNGSAVQNYTQYYTYDEAGNLLSLQHVATTGSFTRSYVIEDYSNQLTSTFVNPATYAYGYDNSGNMTAMPHLDDMAWNAQNQLNGIVRGGNPTHYQYARGQRIRKFTDKTSIKEERIYLGSFEIYRKFDHTNSLTVERTTVHISDGAGRIAMLETRTQGTAGDDNNTAAVLPRYIYSNHLQSACLELDENKNIISYEEYHPYGTTAYQAMNASIHAVAKRYRYTAKERDEESGLYYHGARYYIPWLARWTACDPLESKYAGMSPYNYAFNNPVVFNDPDGNQPEDKRRPGNTRNTTGVWETTNPDGSYTGKPAEPFVLEEVMISSGDPGKAQQNSLAVNGAGEDADAWYRSLGFSKEGYYRNEYSKEDFSGPDNYLRFLDNAAGSIWNAGVDVVQSFKNFSIEGLKEDVSGTYNYYTQSSVSKIWTDTKVQFKAMVSDIRTYENIAGVALFKTPSVTTTTVSFEFTNVVMGAAKGGTTGFRYMTEGELQAIRYGDGAGFLRGGNPGKTYFTKDLYKSGVHAQQRLSLPTAPTLRVEFEILNNPTMRLKSFTRFWYAW